jgi:hypothetical protein
MTTAFNEEEFINQCAKGNVELAEKKLKKDNLDINCKERESKCLIIELSTQRLMLLQQMISLKF